MDASRLEVASVASSSLFKTKVHSIQSQFSASKFMIATGAGVIDADYRGVVFILLYNLSDKDFQGIFVSSSCYYLFGVFVFSGRR
jgi:hypothetical protein